jgi:hypothetical protein
MSNEIILSVTTFFFYFYSLMQSLVLYFLNALQVQLRNQTRHYGMMLLQTLKIGSITEWINIMDW